MYDDPKLKRRNETKVRLSDPVEQIVAMEAERQGMQRAAWMRRIIEQYLEEQGFEFPRELTKDQLRSRQAG